MLLSDPNVVPPTLKYDHLKRLFGKEPLNPASTHLAKGFVGLFVPGIDGDFIEFGAFEATGSIAEAIALECAQTQVRWTVVSEPEFLKTEWCRRV